MNKKVLLQGDILKKATLAEKVAKYSKVKLKKTIVKVPRLRARRQKALKIKQAEKIPISSIIPLLIKSAVEKAKKEGKAKPDVEEQKSYQVLKGEREHIFNGGYGTASKGYGAAPHASYVDYGKLFSYLGKFRAKQPYEDMAEHIGNLNKATESGSFVLADRETMDKGKFYLRYINSKIPIDKSSLVPIAGMNSAEWEQFKMWMRLDTATYLLKISTS
ncbi:hypothetical protein HYY71_03440 [Candidatus Woesearchaeota archaeon]|nr:hypothetical protein [Candidatus Woesearchaeota archaeon]